MKTLRTIALGLALAVLACLCPITGAVADINGDLVTKIWSVTNPATGTDWEKELKTKFVTATGINSSTATGAIQWYPRSAMLTGVSHPWTGQPLFSGTMQNPNNHVSLPSTHTPGTAEIVRTVETSGAQKTYTYTSYTASDAATPELVMKEPNGTHNAAENVYTVYTGEALRYVMNLFTDNNYTGTVILGCSIDLNGQDADWGYARMTQGQTFDGGGNTIYNLRIATTEPRTSRTGFVSTADRGLTFQNTTFQTGYIFSADTSTSNTRTALIAFLSGPTFRIQNLEAVGFTVVGKGENAAVLISRSGDGALANQPARTVTNCLVRDSVVFGSSHVASLTSCMFKTNYENCFTVGCTVLSTGIHSGGFVSCGNTVSFKSCFTDVHLYGSTDTGVFIGSANTTKGVGGSCTFTDCFASGFVDGTDRVGGFIGKITDNDSVFSFDRCYSTALVGLRANGTQLGGFAGMYTSGGNPSVTMRECYAAGEVGNVDTDLSGDPLSGTQAESTGGFMGDCNLNTRSGMTFIECYYDKQTTAMREWGVGRITNAAGVSGAPVGVLTTDSAKSGNGLATYATVPSGGFQPFSSAAAWSYASVSHYPELAAFHDAKASDWGDEKTANLVRAYSLSSTSTVRLDTWDYGLDVATGKIGVSGEALDKVIYCTVRDLTSGFDLTANNIKKWERVGTADSREPQDSTVVILGETYDVLDLKHQNNAWLCDSLVPGVEWLRVACTYGSGEDEAVATRRLRVIPTASIEAGKSVVIVDKYDHADDVELLFSEAKRLAKDMNDISTGIYPDLEGQANAITPRQTLLVENKRVWPFPDFSASNDQYLHTSADYMKTNDDNATGSELFVYAYKVTGFGSNHEILYDEDRFIPLTNLSGFTAFGRQLNGYEDFENLDQRYLVCYYWRLRDKRVLQDAKLIRRAAVPFHVNLNLYQNAIADANLYPAGGYLYTGIDQTSKPILSDFSGFTTVASQTAAVVGLANYKQNAQTAWKIKSGAETMLRLKLTVRISDTEEYHAVLDNPAADDYITVPCVEYRIVYRNGHYYTIPQNVNRVYQLKQDAGTGTWYLNFTKRDERGQLYPLSDVENNLRVDVVVKASDKGGLTLSKTVAGANADQSRFFTFQVVFGDNGAYAYTGSKTGTLQSGGTVTLKHGQSVTFADIPAGVAYQVTELEANQDGYVTSATNASGTILANATQHAAFENTKLTQKGSLTLSKTVTGANADQSRFFTFQVVFGDNGAYAYTGSKTGTLRSGETVTLKHGQSVTFSDIPAGVAYRVTELEADQGGYVTRATGTSGTILDNVTQHAAFENMKYTQPPKTGDQTPLMLLFMLMLLSCGIGMALWRNRNHCR